MACACWNCIFFVVIVRSHWLNVLDIRRYEHLPLVLIWTEPKRSILNKFNFECPLFFSTTLYQSIRPQNSQIAQKNIYIFFVYERLSAALVYSVTHLLPAAEGRVHSVDGKLTDIEKNWIHKYIQIPPCVLRAAYCSSLALKHTRE